MRLLDRGLRHLFLPDIRVHHMSAPAARLTPFFYRTYMRNLAYIATKLLRPRDAVVAVAHLAVMALLRAIANPRLARCLAAVPAGAWQGMRRRSRRKPGVGHVPVQLVDFVNPLRFVAARIPVASRCGVAGTGAKGRSSTRSAPRGFSCRPRSRLSMTPLTNLASERFDTLIVGAGFAGSVLAERLANRCGQRVGVIDRRGHIAGNAYDYVDEHGVLCHRYGPHVFHTSAKRVWRDLSQFTDWSPYVDRVLSRVDGQLLPFPINRDTVNRLYSLALASDQDMRSFLASRREHRDPIQTSEDVIVAFAAATCTRSSFVATPASSGGSILPNSDVIGLCPHSGASEPGRSLFLGLFPVHAQRRLHQDVRANALPSEHRSWAIAGLRRGPRSAPVRSSCLYRVD